MNYKKMKKDKLILELKKRDDKINQVDLHIKSEVNGIKRELTEEYGRLDEFKEQTALMREQRDSAIDGRNMLSVKIKKLESEIITQAQILEALTESQEEYEDQIGHKNTIIVHLASAQASLVVELERRKDSK